MNKAITTGILLLLFPILPLVVTAADNGWPCHITSTSAPTVDLKHDPSVIFYNADPSILLVVQGDSVLSPILRTDHRFVLNTNRDLFYDKKNSTCEMNKPG